MAIPTISAVSPDHGHTGGRHAVRVDGTNFRLPPALPASGPVPEGQPTVRVEVGGVRSPSVQVVSSGRLYYVSPVHDPGDATVVVINLDDDGAPISGETAALVDGFNYRLPPLTGRENEGVLARITRQLLREMKRQILPNVVLTVSVDYDPDSSDGSNRIDPATMPGIALLGPDLTRNYVNSRNVWREASVGDEFWLGRPPRTHDAAFQVVGIADSVVPLLNLMEATQLFVDRNPYLLVPLDPDDPAAGDARLELAFAPGGDLKASSPANESDIRTFRGVLVLRGIELANLAGFGEDSNVARGASVDSLELGNEQKG